MRQFFSSIRNNFRWYFLIALFFLAICLSYVCISENRHGKMTISFLNVGQGDSIFIESPTGIQVLIDGGPNKTLSKEISRVMPWYDRNIDMIVVTNPDKDHFEGFISFLDKFSVEVELEPGTIPQSETYSLLEKKLEDKKITKITALRRQIIDIGGGAYLQVLFPDRDISSLSTNNGSLIMHLIYGKTSVLLMGDAPQAMENYLVSLDGEKLKSNILKVGHHGSKTSTSEIFVSAVSPQYAVISVDKDNKYGHPNKETLDVLDKNKVEILRTDEIGRITFVSDGLSFEQK